MIGHSPLAQLAERQVVSPDIRCSNPTISKFWNVFLSALTTILFAHIDYLAEVIYPSQVFLMLRPWWTGIMALLSLRWFCLQLHPTLTFTHVKSNIWIDLLINFISILFKEDEKKIWDSVWPVQKIDSCAFKFSKLINLSLIVQVKILSLIIFSHIVINHSNLELKLRPWKKQLWCLAKTDYDNSLEMKIKTPTKTPLTGFPYQATHFLPIQGITLLPSPFHLLHQSIFLSILRLFNYIFNFVGSECLICF